MRSVVCGLLLFILALAVACRGKKDESSGPSEAPKGGLERLVGTWEFERKSEETGKHILEIRDDRTGSYTIEIDGRPGFVTRVVPILRQGLGEKATDLEFDKQVKSVAVRLVTRFPFRVEQVSGEEITLAFGAPEGSQICSQGFLDYVESTGGAALAIRLQAALDEAARQISVDQLAFVKDSYSYQKYRVEERRLFFLARKPGQTDSAYRKVD